MKPPPLPGAPRDLGPAPSQAKVLHRLYLTLFLRGRSSRGVQKEGAPKSVGRKLALALIIYVFFGSFMLGLHGQPVFTLSICLHSMTFIFLGMFVAASGGEMLFNRDEAEILLHRPVAPRAMLWAKISVLVEVSLWLAGALNFIGFFLGLGASDGGWLFIPAHAVSTALEAIFCTGSVVLVYQFCLRWFGRERLDGIMTTAQILVSISFITAGQVLPRVAGRVDHLLGSHALPPWVRLLPPTWFAGLDDAIAGSSNSFSLVLACVAVGATAIVLTLAFGRLAADYESGLQRLGEGSAPAKPQDARRRWLSSAVEKPPFRWWLRDPIERASFLLCAAYLLRDRDVKLRIYPGLAPTLVLPIVLLLQSHADYGGFGSFGLAFAGAYVGCVPMLGLSLLQFSQQWQASDLFRVAPVAGPAPFCHGARRAVISILALPVVAAILTVALLLTHNYANVFLLLPGLIILPIYAMLPCVTGAAIPLSQPTEEAKSAGRGLAMMGASLFAALISGLASVAWHYGWFAPSVLAEALLAAIAYFWMRRAAARVTWPKLE
jgi:ABC-2 type transport system permease protein